MSIAELARDAGLSAPRRYQVDWDRAEASVGTRLPTDYKEYVYWFGPGSFDDYLIVCVPGVENGNTELATRLAKEQADARLRAQLAPSSPRFELFPEPGGWLPWGFTTGGDGLYWVTSSDDSDHWTIAGRPSRGSDYSLFDGSFSAFLHTFIWGTVEMYFIPEAEGDVPIAFEPQSGEWLGAQGCAWKPMDASGRPDHRPMWISSSSRCAAPGERRRRKGRSGPGAAEVTFGVGPIRRGRQPCRCRCRRHVTGHAMTKPETACCPPRPKRAPDTKSSWTARRLRGEGDALQPARAMTIS